MSGLRDIFFHLPLWTALAGGAALCALACGWAAARGLQLLRALLAAVLALHLAVFLYAAGSYVLYPWEGKSVVEGAVLYNARGYLSGEQPYRAPSELPFRSMVYPPAHEMALAGFLSLAGPSPAAARFFSLLCALAAAVVAGWVVWRRTRAGWPATLGAFAVIACYGVTGHWYEQIRCDAQVMFLTALGLALVERASEKRRWPAAGLIALLLALFTKQVALFAPAAALLFLWTRSRRQAATWGAAFAALSLAAFAAMQSWSGGWFAFYTLRVPFSAGWDPGKYDLASTVIGTAWLLFGVAAVLSAVEIRAALRRAHDGADGEAPATSSEPDGALLWALAFALALPLCLLQSLKWGAALNAFIPLTPLLGVLFGLGVHRAMARAGTNPWPVAAGTALVAMQFALLSYQPLVPTPRDYHAQERIRTWVRAAPGEVFVSVFSSQAYLNGKAYFGDDVTLGDLARAGVESRNGLVEAVRRGQFSLLVLRPRLEPEEFADAVRERYTPVERIPMRTDIARWPYMDVYTPRDAPWHPAE